MQPTLATRPRSRWLGMLAYEFIIELASIVVVAVMFLLGQQTTATFQSIVALVSNPAR